MKKKLIISFVIMFLALLILPFILTNLASPHEFMGVMIFLFFIVNPLATAIINSMIGKDIKKLFWMPILFSIFFLLSYWLVLKEVIMDLLFYVGIYLVIGFIFMIGSFLISKSLKSKNEKDL